MPDTTDELRSAIDLAVGRAVLAACALALLITPFVPMTRWMGEWVDDNGPLQEDVVPPVCLLIPLVTVAAAPWTVVAHRRLYG